MHYRLYKYNGRSSGHVWGAGSGAACHSGLGAATQVHAERASTPYARGRYVIQQPARSCSPRRHVPARGRIGQRASQVMRQAHTAATCRPMRISCASDDGLLLCVCPTRSARRESGGAPCSMPLSAPETDGIRVRPCASAWCCWTSEGRRWGGRRCGGGGRHVHLAEQD